MKKHPIAIALILLALIAAVGWLGYRGAIGSSGVATQPTPGREAKIVRVTRDDVRQVLVVPGEVVPALQRELSFPILGLFHCLDDHVRRVNRHQRLARTASGTATAHAPQDQGYVRFQSPISNLHRIFEDAAGKFNLSALDVGAEVLVISQFTLYGDARKGRRPSFTQAARPEVAEPLCDRFAALLEEAGLRVETGEFGARMLVQILNDGPVTIILERELE